MLRLLPLGLAVEAAGRQRLWVHDAFESLVPAGSGAAFLSCEHASNRLPEGYDWGDDAWLREQHWAFDLGAADLTRELAAATGAGAVLSRFSRLLVDPNREPEAETLFRGEAEGRSVVLNGNLSDGEKRRRIAGYYEPYHRALRSGFEDSGVPLLFSIHSFTPIYEGARRPMEIGVLFDREDDGAAQLGAMLREAGFATAMNEPYSGKAGLIFSAEHHAQALGRRALELEVRQDVCVDPEFRGRLIACLKAFFEAFE